MALGGLRSWVKRSSTWRRAPLGLRLACVIAVLANVSLAEDTGLVPETYLYPILRFGPNNQLRDLRHILALAMRLETGVVLTGVTKHYIDAGRVFDKAQLVHTPSGGLAGPAPVRHHTKPGQAKGGGGGAGSKAGGKPRRTALQQGAGSGRVEAAADQLHHPQGTRSTVLLPSLAAHRDNARRSAVATPAGAASGSGEGASAAAAAGQGGSKAIRTARALKPPPPPKLPHCFNRTNYMPMERILDLEPIRKQVRAATVHELRERGWNGQLDAVMYPEGEHKWKSAWRYHTSSTVPENVTFAPGYAHVMVPEPLQCNERKIGELKERVKKFRVVGVLLVLLGWHEDPDLRELPKPTAPCQLAMWTANQLVRPSPWISGLAQTYMQRHLAEAALAVHIRPFPDSCLDSWRRPLPAGPLEECLGPHKELHLRLGRCVQAMLKQHGLRRVVVLIHPAAIPSASQLLHQAGLNSSVQYVDGHEVRSQAGCIDTSATFLSLVEMEIAAHAHAFLGTSTSSVTQSIALERQALGRHANAYLEDMQC